MGLWYFTLWWLQTKQFSLELTWCTLTSELRLQQFNKSNPALRLSAYLYEITQNQTYYDAASLAHKFIQSHLYDPTGSIKHMLNLTDCTYPNTFILTYNTGLYIEGLSCWGIQPVTRNYCICTYTSSIPLSKFLKSSWAILHILKSVLSADLLSRTTVMSARWVDPIGVLFSNMKFISPGLIHSHCHEL